MKFIRKDKVLTSSWCDDPVLGTVPFEISLLTKLKHPNIVKVRAIQLMCIDYSGHLLNHAPYNLSESNTLNLKYHLKGMYR